MSTAALLDDVMALPDPATPKAASRKQTVILLGPQGRAETLASTLDEHRIRGKIATVTAGWQEREDDIQALQAHLDGRSENLQLYARGLEIFRDDPELEDVHRERGSRLRELQRLYDVRVEHAMAAVSELASRTGRSDLVEQEWAAAVSTVRGIDEEHALKIERIHDQFQRRLKLTKRDGVTKARKEIAKIIKGCSAVAIAGGHVAVLLNRLRLFDLARAAGDKPVVAWSAGAMVVSERVVVYHDSPPQGAGNPEVLELGLGLVQGVIPLPHARTRLRLDDRARVSRFARRFAPARCIAMDDHARLTVGPKGWSASKETRELTVSGQVKPLGAK